MRQLLYILEGQKEEKIKNIRCVYTRPSSQSFPRGNSLVWPRSAAGADLGGGYRGCAAGGGGGGGGGAPPPPPPPPPEMTCGFLIQLVFRKKKTMRFIGVEVEQETSAPPPRKDPGSAPVPGFDYFHVCGYTPINALNILVNIMKVT